MKIVIVLILLLSATVTVADEFERSTRPMFLETHTPNGDGGLDIVLDIQDKTNIGTADVVGAPDAPGKILLEDLLKSGGLVAHLFGKAEGNDSAKVQDVAHKALLAKQSGKKHLEDAATAGLLEKLLEKYPVNKSRHVAAIGNMGLTHLSGGDMEVHYNATSYHTRKRWKRHQAGTHPREDSLHRPGN